MRCIVGNFSVTWTIQRGTKVWRGTKISNLSLSWFSLSLSCDSLSFSLFKPSFAFFKEVALFLAWWVTFLWALFSSVILMLHRHCVLYVSWLSLCFSWVQFYWAFGEPFVVIWILSFWEECWTCNRSFAGLLAWFHSLGDIRFSSTTMLYVAFGIRTIHNKLTIERPKSYESSHSFQNIMQTYMCCSL